MQFKLLITLPAAGIEPAPAACAAVHLYTTPAFSSVMLCYKVCIKQYIYNATKTICNAAMQHCYKHRMLLHKCYYYPPN